MKEKIGRRKKNVTQSHMTLIFTMRARSLKGDVLWDKEMYVFGINPASLI